MARSYPNAVPEPIAPKSQKPRKVQAFAELLDRLSLTASRNAKLTLVRDWPGANREPELSEVVDTLRTASRAEVQLVNEGGVRRRARRTA